MWKPIQASAMRHIIERMSNVAASDEHVARATQGFWTRTDSVFHFSAQVRAIGDTVVMRTTQSALRIRGDEVRSTGTVHIAFLLDGSCEFGQSNGDVHTISRGGLFVTSDWAGYNLTAPESTRVLSIRMRESRLQERGVRVAAHQYRFGGAGPSLSAPLRELGLSIADASWNPSKPALMVAGRAVEDLVVGMFLEAGGYAMDSEDLRAGLRSRAMAYIAERHRDQALSPQAVAAPLGVSLRHLQRAFQDSGTSIAAEIAGQRAETAALYLASPGARTATMGELAARSGFSSAYELRAAFAARFGMLPSAYRSTLPAT